MIEKTLRPQKICTRAPGKIILSGEHAVVFGNPVLATAIQLYANTTIQPNTPTDVLLDLVNLSHKRRRTLAALRTLNHRLKKDYQRFKSGQLPIREVIKKPFELMEYTISRFMDKVGKHLKNGVHIHHHSELPTGCGMGSSAASIISTNWALNLYYQQNLSLEQVLELSLETENLQHGQSSGIDLYLATYGGTWLVENHQYQEIRLEKCPLYWLNTGAPLSSTGECVHHTNKIFQENPELLKEFEKCTLEMANAIEQNDHDRLTQAIKVNHQLLVKIGVVPPAIQQIIKQIEAAGGAAKICGAGSITGISAGIVLVYIKETENLASLCKEHNYTLNPLRACPTGVGQI